MYSDKRGKRNKLKIGDKVISTKEDVDWNASHLCWSFGRDASSKEGYSEGEREFGIEDLRIVGSHIWYMLSNKQPRGTVLGFGAKDNDNGIDRNNVYVEFDFKTPFGNFKYGAYKHERKHVVKLEKKDVK